MLLLYVCIYNNIIYIAKQCVLSLAIQYTIIREIYCIVLKNDILQCKYSISAKTGLFDLIFIIFL